MRPARPFDAYLICTSPRSGSTLLCSLLRATGIAGEPDSWFHGAGVADWAHELGLAPEPGEGEAALLRRVFEAALAAGRGGTDMFGLRLQQGSLAYFMRKLAELYPGAEGDRARLEAAFGRTAFIYLKREDKVAQAVSLVKAEQSGLWHMAPDGSELERLAPPAEPFYDREAIAAAVAEFEAGERAWEAWFAREGVAPMRLDYDALAGDPGAVLAGVLDRLGLEPGAAKAVALGVRRLADAMSRDWAARYRAGEGMEG